MMYRRGGIKYGCTTPYPGIPTDYFTPPVMTISRLIKNDTTMGVKGKKCDIKPAKTVLPSSRYLAQHTPPPPAATKSSARAWLYYIITVIGF